MWTQVSTTAEENSTDNTPSSMATLTEEQRKFLKDCEAEFANRYTDDDPEFVHEREAGLSTPPIVDPWYNKPRRNFDWSRQQGNSSRRHQNWGGRNEQHNNERGGYQHHRQTDRNRYKPY